MAIAKSKGKINEAMKQRNYTKDKEKNIKSNNLTMSKRKEFNIAVAILKELEIG